MKRIAHKIWIVLFVSISFDSLAQETDPQRAAELFIKMNDMLIDDVVVIPIVQRASEKYGLARDLNKENIAGGPFEAWRR